MLKYGMLPIIYVLVGIIKSKINIEIFKYLYHIVNNIYQEKNIQIQNY